MHELFTISCSRKVRKYKTDFWKGVRPEEAKRNIINFPNSVEELKEDEKFKMM